MARVKIDPDKMQAAADEASIDEPEEGVFAPAPQPAAPLTFLPSGSTLLDLVLGGGWAMGRVANVVGDKSAGKTGLAIEAAANFAILFDPKDIRYAEAEAAFGVDYARSLGLPEEVIPSEPGEISTVEDFYEDLKKFISARPSMQPCMYVLDSLDALSDDAEAKRELGDATYGTGKARMMSEAFRRIIAEVSASNCLLIIISQIRDAIGVTFGPTKTRSGGRALDFYASQVVWLAEVKKLTRTVTKVTRPVGVQVLAKNRKNKVGNPFREAEFSLLFNYGIDDEASMLDWLVKNFGEEYLKPASVSTLRARLTRSRNAQNYEDLADLHEMLKTATQARWEEIEAALRPATKKYHDRHRVRP